jgi:DNA-binding NtrC family response regulator
MPRAQILVVDDEPSILSTLKKVLSLEGYGVDVAGGVSVAESKLAKQTYDVVMLDVALPDGDGLALLSKLMAGGLEAQVIMMSGHATIDAAVQATRLGALDFLEKPLSTDRLLVVLDNALRLTRAEAEAQELRREAGLGDDLIGESKPMLALREQVLRAAKSNASVLLIGERGTGKELIAPFTARRRAPRAR